MIIDGQDQLATLGWDSARSVWIGRRPEDVTGPESVLLATDEPHDAFIARCGCGEEGCGALIAQIARDGNCVVWDEFRRGSDARAEEFAIDIEPIVFDAQQHQAAILGHAETMTAWRPTTRTAAMLVNQRVKGWHSDEHRLRGGGCEDLGDDQIRLTALLGRTGDPDHSILERRFRLESGESAQGLADRVVQYLASGGIIDDELVERSPIG